MGGLKNILVFMAVTLTSSLIAQTADHCSRCNMIITANTSNYVGEGVRSFVGVNILFSEGSLLNRFRLGAEVGAPFYENYTGIQMNEGLSINCGLKYNII